MQIAEDGAAQTITGFSGAGSGESKMVSKLVIVWAAPSSAICISSLVRSGMGLPFLSVTTTSTVTSSTWLGKVGAGSAAGEGEGLGEGLGGGGAWARTRARTN